MRAHCRDDANGLGRGYGTQTLELGMAKQDLTGVLLVLHCSGF